MSRKNKFYIVIKFYICLKKYLMFYIFMLYNVVDIKIWGYKLNTNILFTRGGKCWIKKNRK